MKVSVSVGLVSLFALMCFEAAAGFKLQERWRLNPSDRAYITTQVGGTGDGVSDNLERGIAYNALSNHVLIVSRTNSGATQIRGIYILDAATGKDTGPLTNGVPTPASLNFSTISSGGTFLLVKIRVAADGAIYAMNFGSAPGTATTVYRWANEDTNTLPEIAYPGLIDPADPGMGRYPADPSRRDSSVAGIGLQWGYAFDVRGAGTNTEMVITSSSANSTNAAVLTTSDGTNFVSNFITVTNAAPGSMGVHGCVAWGEGDTFWATAVNSAVLHIAFDRATGMGAVIHQYPATNFPVSLSQFDVDVQNDWLAGIDLTPGLGRTANTPGRTDALRLYNIANPANPPVFLSSSNMLSVTNNPFVAGAVDFGSNFVVALSTHNGVKAFDIVATSETVLPYLIKEPDPQYVTNGSSATFAAYSDGTGPFAYQWRYDRTGASGSAVAIPGATNAVYTIPSAQPSHEGFYSVAVSNAGGTATSLEIPLFVYPESSHSVLTPLWNIAPGSRFWWNLDAGNWGQNMWQRSIAYNARSNQVYVISRSAALAGLSVNVIDGTTGDDLYQLNPTGIAANGTIMLLGMGVADDGAIYAANEVNTSGTGANGIYRLYRWENSDSGTPPVAIFSRQLLAGDTTRWGDTLRVRGSGTNTQIILDNNQGTRIAILSPTNEDLTLPWAVTSVTNLYGPGVLNASGNIGRSLQFGSGDAFWQKRKYDRLLKSTYDLANFNGTTASAFMGYPVTIGPVAVDLSRNLLAGINFCPSTYSILANATLGPVPDTLVLYDIADASNPVPLGQYDFPTNSRPNLSFVGQIVFSGDRLYALDANNGILAFQIVPTETPKLDIARSGSNISVSWTNTAYGYTLESRPTLSASNTWTPVGQPVSNSSGRFSVTDSAAGGQKYYRLRKP